jgi:cytochrome c-type biogenesis protein CcmF
MRVYYKPYMNWVWAGAILMGLGGFLSASDRRYRLRARREEELPVDRAAKDAATAAG